LIFFLVFPLCLISFPDPIPFHIRFSLKASICPIFYILFPSVGWPTSATSAPYTLDFSFSSVSFFFFHRYGFNPATASPTSTHSIFSPTCLRHILYLHVHYIFSIVQVGLCLLIAHSSFILLFLCSILQAGSTLNSDRLPCAPFGIKSSNVLCLFKP